jgi:hypothetical protein
MDAVIQQLNGSKIFWGISMFLVNVGSRHIVADLGIVQEQLLKSKWVKPLIVLSLFFMATRDVYVSLWLSLGFWILFMGLLHEKSKYAFFTVSPTPVSEEEARQAKATLDRYAREHTVLAVPKR